MFRDDSFRPAATNSSALQKTGMLPLSSPLIVTTKRNMRSRSELWEAVGSIEEEELQHVLTKLFMMYEELAERDPENPEADNFFLRLDNAITQSEECNLNRR